MLGVELSEQRVLRLIAAGELEGERAAGSRRWAVPVRSMLAYEDRCYAARVEADGRSRETRSVAEASE